VHTESVDRQPAGAWLVYHANKRIYWHKLGIKEVSEMDFDVNVRERILKLVNEVFDAVVDPNKVSN